MLAELLRDPEFWKHLSIPFVAGVVGWATNWVAIQLTFYPLEAIGKPPWLGWQGIIPSKAAKMAAIFADKTMFRLGTLPELFGNMEPDEIAEHVVRFIDPRLEEYLEQTLFYAGHGPVWRRTPDLVKQQIVARVRDRLPEHIHRLLRQMAEDVEEVLDLKHMLVDLLERNKTLLNRLFLQAGEAEFKFIIRSGLWFGFLFGLGQLAVWSVYKGWWVLPVFGLAVGYVTNWIALNLVFRPLHPKRLGPWVLQGLFLKRQPEVARVWCHLVSREIITVRRLFAAILSGPRAERARELIRDHVRPVTDEALDLWLPVADLLVGPRGLEEIRDSVAETAVEQAMEPFGDWRFIEDRAVVTEEMLRQRMVAMPPEEFQDLLRPCFQEDEMKLILTGAVLGFLAGVAQLVFVFGGAG